MAARPKGREHAKGIVTGRKESLRWRRHAKEKGKESIASIGFWIDRSPGRRQRGWLNTSTLLRVKGAVLSVSDG